MRQSYDVTINLHLEGTSFTSTNMLDLKNPYFRYTGTPAAPPPGLNSTSPSENIWTQLDAQGARNGTILYNRQHTLNLESSDPQQIFCKGNSLGLMLCIGF